MKYVIKHVLPSGKAVYHVDSCCSVSKNKERAKIYEDHTQAQMKEQIKIVKENQHFAFETYSTKYRNSPIWEGVSSVDQMQTFAEIVEQ
jgi:hypothetical protein